MTDRTATVVATLALIGTVVAYHFATVESGLLAYVFSILAGLFARIAVAYTIKAATIRATQSVFDVLDGVAEKDASNR